MADTKISALVAASSITSPDLFTLVQGGVNKKITWLATEQSINLSNVSLGTLADGLLSSNVPLLNASSNTFTGSISASNLSGTNTGNQTITLTGDVTGSGTGSFAASLVAITNATLTTLSALTTASSLASIGTITSGIWAGSTIAIAHGGTGQTTASSAFNALSPMTTAGDMIYGGASGSGTRLPIGTSGQVLTVSAGLPSWQTVSGTGTVTSVALLDGSTTPIYNITGSPVTTSGTLDFTLIAQAAHSFFAGPTSGGSAQPTFRAIVPSDVPTLNQNTTGTAANVTGVVAIANGGTNNSTAYTAGSVIFSNGTALTQDNANFYWDEAHFGLGIGTIPAVNAAIDVVNSSGATKAIQFTGYGSNVGIRGRFANGTVLSPTAATAGNTLEFISGRGYGDTGFATASTGAINFVAGATFTDTSMPTYITLNVTPTGSTTIAEAMRVNSTGHVLIGTGTDNGTDLLQINGSAIATEFKANSVLIGSAANQISGLSTIINTGTLTLPTSTDTLVGRATTDTLTNKSISGSTNTITNVSLTTGVTGTLPVANGGTGDASFTANQVVIGGTTSTGALQQVAGGTSGFVLTSNGTTAAPTWQATSGGSGTVTSVALSDGSTTPIFNITGSPVTTSGTLTQTLATQSANTIFAGPTTGSAAQPGFRSLVGADIPNNAANTTGTASNITGTSNSTLTTLSALTTASSLASVGTITSGTWNGTTIAIAHGGTGQTSASSAFGALSPLTTKGDLLGYDTANNRIPVGTNGQVLTADSTQTLGLKWATPSSGSGTVTSVAMTVPSFLSVSGSPITTSGTLAVSLSGTALPIANGGTGVTSVTTTPTATSFAGWDANSNLAANNLIDGYATTATAAATTTLTVASASQQYFTGTTTQTVKLPVVSTLMLGMAFTIVNNSSGAVTVQSSGSNTLQVLAANTQLVATVISTSGTGTASWSWIYSLETPGTVTSVAMTVPSFLSVSGSPVTSSGTLALSLSGTALPVTSGGTGDTSLTAYALLAGGTTSTGAVQSISGVGTSGQVLTSNGASALPTWQAAAGGTQDFVKIAQTILSNATTTTVTFSSIPGTYNNLKLVFMGASTINASNDTVFIRFNGDTGNNYSYSILQLGNFASPTGSVAGSQSAINLGTITGQQSANESDSIEILFANYTTTSFWKTSLSTGSAESGNTGQLYMYIVGGHWSNTAAITQIDIFMANAFSQGSTFTLYGMT